MKGLQLPFDCHADKLVASAAQLAHDLVVVSIYIYINPFGCCIFKAGNSPVELIAQYLKYQRAAEGASEVIKGLEAARDGLSPRSLS